MRKLLVLLIPAFLAAAFVGCSQDQEVISTTAPASGTHTATASATPSTTATAPASGTVTPTATATAVVLPTPTDTWKTYTNPTLGFSFSYPPGWTLQEYQSDTKVRIASFDLTNWNTPNYPPGGILVDLTRIGVDQAEPQPSDAVAAYLGALAGWMRRQASTGEAPWAKAVTYAAISGDYEYSVGAAFQAEDADETIALDIASSFALTK